MLTSARVCTASHTRLRRPNNTKLASLARVALFWWQTSESLGSFNKLVPPDQDSMRRRQSSLGSLSQHTRELTHISRCWRPLGLLLRLRAHPPKLRSIGQFLVGIIVSAIRNWIEKCVLALNRLIQPFLGRRRRVFVPGFT